MIYISSDSSGMDVINLTRGDDAELTVPLTDDAGEPYEMGETEYLIFSMREKPVPESELLLELESEPGTDIITFTHADTADMAVGFYSAEVQLMTSDGKRVTVWPKLTGGQRTSANNRKNFCLMSEVVMR